jgi:hypothetical protein
MQDKSLIRSTLLEQGVDPADSPWEYICECGNAPTGARAQTSDQKVGLPAEDCELIFGENCGKARYLRDGTAGQLNAHDVGVFMSHCCDEGGIEIDAIGDTWKVVYHNGQSASLSDLPEEILQNLGRRRWSEVCGWKDQN